MENREQNLPSSISTIEPQVVQTLEQKPYGKRNWKKWLIIYVVIALLFYGGVYYFFLNKSSNPYSSNYPSPTIAKTPTVIPTVDPTANWKFYESLKYGFVFLYPPEWKVITETSVKDVSENSDLFKGCTIYLQNTQDKTTVIPINIADKNSDGGYCWSYGYFYDDHKRQITSITPSKEIQVSKWRMPIGNYEDTKSQTLWKGDFFQFYTFNGTKNDVSIGFLYQSNKNNTTEKVYDQILSTFKFTDPISADISTWKEYANTKYNYTIKYPEQISFTETNGPSYVEFDKQIAILVQAQNPFTCQGCPPLKAEIEDTVLNGYAAKKLIGNQTAMGMVGSGPKYQSIIISHNNLFYTIIIYEFIPDVNHWESVGDIPKDKLDLYNKMLSSFKFIQ